MIRLTQPLVVLAWLTATLSVTCAYGNRELNLAFVAAVGLAVLAAFTDWRAVRALPRRELLPSSGLILLAIWLPALALGATPALCLGAARYGAAWAWFLVLLSLGPQRAKQTLLYAALALLMVDVIALACSVLPGFSAFERVQHEFVANVPRFRGLANGPATAGVWALVSIGLSEASADHRLRWLARGLGLLFACLSLSIALLALPAMLAALVPRRRLRGVLVGLGAVVAAAVLYFQPLELNVAGRTVELTRELPQYFTGGLGPENMPKISFGVTGMTLRGHATAYGKLAFRGLTCFGQHPLFGVGPGGFRESCRVVAMNTFGEWTDQRNSHNQFGAVLSELGLVGVALLSAAWLVLRRGYVIDSLTSWQRAVWLGLLVCGLGSEDLLTLPVLGLLASQLSRRNPSSSVSAEPTSPMLARS